MSGFCFFCGTAPLERTTSRDCYFCSLCKSEFKIEILRETQITLEQAQDAFNAIPLTDKKALRAAKRKR